MRTAKPAGMDPALIAPCGLNCRLCRAYVRDRKACSGCRGDDGLKSRNCVSCPIRNCPQRADGGLVYCFDCDLFPCARLRRLEKRYAVRYGVSVLDNLRQIRAGGIRSFIAAENGKWRCPDCGAMLCMHKAQCAVCGRIWRD